MKSLIPSSPEGWNTIFQWVSIIFIAGTVFAGAGAIFTGRIMSRGQAKELAFANAEAAKANAGVAKAQEETAEANRRAGVANESAAKANERAAVLEKQAADARKEVAALTVQAEQARNESTKLRTDLTSAETRLTLEQQKTATALKDAAQTLVSAQFSSQQMRSLATPRRLVRGRNREAFVASLKGKPPSTVDILWFNDFFIHEPTSCAEDIGDALREVGWTVNVHGALLATSSDPFNVTIPSGLKIPVENPDKPSSPAADLYLALLQADLVADFVPSHKPDGDTVQLIVFMIPLDGGRVMHFVEERKKEQRNR